MGSEQKMSWAKREDHDSVAEMPEFYGEMSSREARAHELGVFTGREGQDAITGSEIRNWYV